MSETVPRTGAGGITRRDFLAATTAITLNSSIMGRWARAKENTPRDLGSLTEIQVPTNGPLHLSIDRTPINVAGRPATSAITVNGSLPGPVLRMHEGQDVVIHVQNRLKDEDSSIHWHGLILPTTMDGVPGVSFPGIKPGETFTYRYRARQSGTYWYHSHSGLQEQLGHYGVLVIDPVDRDPFEYDREYVVVLSDWTFENPYRVLEKLKTFEGYYNYQRPTVANLITDAKSKGLGAEIRQRLKWDAMRMDPTDIADITGATYTYLMNGRSPHENWTAIVKPGERVRLRLVNTATMTYFDFRIPGLPMTVVAADGQNIKPVETDELRIAVAETYDVLVTLPDNRAYTLFAETMDRSGYTRGTLAPRPGMSPPTPRRRQRSMRTMADMGMAGGSMGMNGMAMPKKSAHKGKTHRNSTGHDISSKPHGMGLAPIILPTQNLPETTMHGPGGHGPSTSMTAMMPRRRYADPGIGLGKDGWRVLKYADLRALRRLPDRRAPDRQFDLHLTGNMGRYIWGFDGKKFSEADMIRFVYGERVRINMINDTMMEHPIHLHGMWMDLYAGGTLEDNPRKHTVSVKPGELLTVDITADAPGYWAFHCHLLFHMDMGMYRTVVVARSVQEHKKS